MSYKLNNTIKTLTGWEIIENCYNNEQLINSGTNFMIGNGYLGYRGTLAEDKKEEFVGCIVTDTWDKADGKWEELCTVPNALFIELYVDNEKISVKNDVPVIFERKLDFKSGENYAKIKFEKNNFEILIEEYKFSSFKNIRLIPQKYTFFLNKNSKVKIISGIDGDIWSLNGEHFKEYKYYEKNNSLICKTITQEKEVEIFIGETFKININDYSSKIIKNEKGIFREIIFDIEKNIPITIEKNMYVYHSNDFDKPENEIYKEMIKEQSYDLLKQKNEIIWEDKWNNFDIKIDGNIIDQTAVRFNIFHNIISTPSHKSLPIGARGLSCQAYQGAAFWDQEIFNMPMYLYSEPNTAKKILKYRYDTLNGARRKAYRLGFKGAFYAWISGKTGDELCPDFFFKDVITNRPIRNHFNDWQIHISPDVAYAVYQYYHVTNDWDFIVNYGAELIFEVSRFISSRVCFKALKNQYEIIRVQGPDEYHENVDNNAFTNYQCHYVLRKSIEILEIMENKNLEKLQLIKSKISLTNNEIELWEDIIEKLYLPAPNEKGIIEQFDNYFDLEEVIPAEKIKERLIKDDEYYGWPNGITVFTQTIKQADVIQLFILHPNIFHKDLIRKNYQFYEPRTLHFSSLSPSSYSIAAAMSGYIDEAYKNFHRSIFIDINNTNEPFSGGTFIGGMHTAAAGAAWQMLVKGFAGFKLGENKELIFEPNLPPNWNFMFFKLIIENNVYEINISNEELKISCKYNIENLKEIVFFDKKYSFSKNNNILQIKLH